MPAVNAASSRRRRGAAARDQSALQTGARESSRPLLWYQSTWAPAFASALAMWAALPPLDLWPLAWIAPVGWLVIARRRDLAGKRPYLVVYASGFACWLGVLHWLRLPHWAVIFGWIAGAAYLAFGVLLFVFLVRVAIHRWRWPLMLAAPVVWTATELIRGHALGGFTMGSLGHTQYHWLSVIQIADLFGAYGVSFVVIIGAAAIAAALPLDGRSWSFRPLFVFATILVTVVGYGQYRLQQYEPREGPSVALLQGSFDAVMNAPRTRNEEIQDEYIRLSRKAKSERPDVDLIVWPETMFCRPLFIYDEETFPPHDADWNIEDLRASAEKHRNDIAALAQEMETDLLLGISIYEYGRGTVDGFNSAIHVTPDGQVMGRYDKMSPVMFGEYMPLVEYFPALQSITPLTGSIGAGDRALAFDIDGTSISPSICYEDVLPHVIRRQLRQLAGDDEEVDVLVNLTNDGWYYGSSELDMHLICAIFRAVEFRKPMLVAANTGFSAWIDGNGQVIERGPRRATDIIFADVLLDDRQSWYQASGDLLAGICLLFTIFLFATAIYDRLRRRHRPADASPAP